MQTLLVPQWGNSCYSRTRVRKINKEKLFTNKKSTKKVLYKSNLHYVQKGFNAIKPEWFL